MAETYFDPRRLKLKLELLRRRSVIIGKGRFPICPWCRLAIMGDAEMNEVLLTRGDAQGLEDPWIIMTRYNCVLMHPQCHTKHGHTYEGRVLCVKQIIGYEKPEKVIGWLKSIRPHFKGAMGLVDEAIRLVDRCRRNNEESSYFL